MDLHDALTRQAEMPYSQNALKEHETSNLSVCSNQPLMYSCGIPVQCECLHNSSQKAQVQETSLEVWLNRCSHDPRQTLKDQTNSSPTEYHYSKEKQTSILNSSPTEYNYSKDTETSILNSSPTEYNHPENNQTNIVNSSPIDYNHPENKQTNILNSSPTIHNSYDRMNVSSPFTTNTNNNRIDQEAFIAQQEQSKPTASPSPNGMPNDDFLRIFSKILKQKCWEKAKMVPGRDPDRWRYDAVGNVVARKLTGCEGCLCHEYDHIVPWSKGGTSSVANCQILQTRVNRFKGNDDNDLSRMALFSCGRRFSDAELDVVEMAIWGDVHSEARQCRCKSVMEMSAEWKKLWNSKKMRQNEGKPDCQ